LETKSTVRVEGTVKRQLLSVSDKTLLTAGIMNV